MVEPLEADPVAAYYNRNTRLFLCLGGSGENTAAIHRQVWAPGVRTRHESFETVNRLVMTALKPVQTAQPRLLDLGCGIGGSSTWAASHLNAAVVGVTLSGAQEQQAGQRAAAMGLGQQCRFVQADFCALPELGLFDGAWAIESFSHAAAPGRFFEHAARSLRAGGRLVVVDDFMTPSAAGLPAGAPGRVWMDTLRAGWKLANLGTLAAAQSAAAAAGLSWVTGQNLSPYLRYIPGWLASAAAGLFRLPFPSLFWHSLRGSNALQICGRQGWTEYHLLVWEKAGG